MREEVKQFFDASMTYVTEYTHAVATLSQALEGDQTPVAYEALVSLIQLVMLEGERLFNIKQALEQSLGDEPTH